MSKPYFCQNFFLTDWRHKRLKNTIDLLLFYGEHFYEFSESVIIILLALTTGDRIVTQISIAFGIKLCIA